ncbi:MAG: acyl--CoA ligase [Actinobacteria bacterium]|nr:acyl--CoA ligase [Actinomycetota bacterium]
MDQAAIDRFQFEGQDIPWLLDHWATNTPDNDFLVWEPRSGNEERWTYRRFVDDVEKVAAALSSKGVSEGQHVLIHSENSPEMVIAWYACARLGAIGVTTNTRSVAAEINYFAEHTGCVGAITQPQFAEVVDKAAPGLGFLVVTDDNSGEAAEAYSVDREVTSFADLLSHDLPAAERVEADPLRPVGVLFTSGTTSKPKAVVHTHGNALWEAKIGPRNIDLETGDVYLAYLPFFHVNSQSWATWSTLGVGGTVVLQPKFSASRFWEVILKHKVTHISLIPFVFKAIGAQPVPEHTVKVGVFGLIMPVLDAWLGMRVVAAYGMTELVAHAIVSNKHEFYPEMAMGRPSPGYEVIVVDPETEELVNRGEIGEIWVRGTRGIQVFKEYYNNDEANAKTFTEDGWVKTGDLVLLGEDGHYYYRDRDKDALKVGGENVSAREVEDVIRTAGPMADVAVVGKTHEMLDQVAVAFVIKGMGAPEDDAEFEAQIIAACRENLADFKVPRAVYFVEEFPEALLGKVAKNVLREWADDKPAI